MKHQKQLATALLLAAACSLQAQRSETLLEKNWKFSKGDIKEASQPEFNGLRPGVVGLLAAAALVLMNGENFGTDTYQVVISILLFIGCFIASNRYKVNPILLIVCSGILGYFIY